MRSTSLRVAVDLVVHLKSHWQPPRNSVCMHKCMRTLKYAYACVDAMFEVSNARRLGIPGLQLILEPIAMEEKKIGAQELPKPGASACTCYGKPVQL